MEENSPLPENYAENCDVCDKHQTEKMYLLKDVFGMVSFQKSLVESIYVTPFWFNGAFVTKNDKPVDPKPSKRLSKLKMVKLALEIVLFHCN